MANLDGAGTHDMLLCGACQPDAGGEHKYKPLQRLELH